MKLLYTLDAQILIPSLYVRSAWQNATTPETTVYSYQSIIEGGRLMMIYAIGALAIGNLNHDQNVATVVIGCHGKPNHCGQGGMTTGFIPLTNTNICHGYR